MTPRIGQEMRYFPAQRSDGEQPWLAFVAYVHSGSSKVNLAIFDQNGVPFSRGRGIRVVHEGELPPLRGEAYCTFAT